MAFRKYLSFQKLVSGTWRGVCCCSWKFFFRLHLCHEIQNFPVGYFFSEAILSITSTGPKSACHTWALNHKPVSWLSHCLSWSCIILASMKCLDTFKRRTMDKIYSQTNRLPSLFLVPCVWNDELLVPFCLCCTDRCVCFWREEHRRRKWTSRVMTPSASLFRLPTQTSSRCKESQLSRALLIITLLLLSELFTGFSNQTCSVAKLVTELWVSVSHFESLKSWIFLRTKFIT